MLSVTFNHALRTQHAVDLASSLEATLGDPLVAPASQRWRTRFAPAPTGFLHVGHVVNAIHVWGIARAYGGDVLLRVEDHDRTRSRPEYEAALLDDLDWLGFTNESGSTDEFRRGRTPFRQSDNLAAYEEQLSQLEARGSTYVCRCSRKEIASHSNNEPGAEARYPGTCSSLALEDAIGRSRRVRVAADDEQFVDLRLGVQIQNPHQQCGDFVIRDRNGNFTYQFAVTVDDWQQGIDVVIRGADLLPSTARQLQLARLLGRTKPPQFLHHQLVMREDGVKLSKSLGDTGVREMRSAGLTPNEVLGRAAYEGGLIRNAIPLHVDDLPMLFV